MRRQGTRMRTVRACRIGTMPKRLFELLLIAVAASAPASAQAERSPERILQEIRGHHRGLAVWWMGNSGWLIKSDDLLIGTDLDLESNSRSYPKVNPPPVNP